MNKVSHLIVVSISLILFSCSEQKPQQPNEEATAPEKATAESCKLAVGWEPWEPYMYLTPGNEVSGLDIEIIRAIADENDCKLEFVQGDWKSLLEMVEDGEVDIVAGASISPSREQYALFSDAYRSEDFVLYVRASEVADYGSTLQEALDSQKTFGITADYIYGKDLDKFIEDPYYSKLFITSDFGEMNYYNLLQHRVDVFVEDPFVGAYNLNRKGLNNQIIALPVVIHSGEVHLMFSKLSTYPQQVGMFNAALSKIKKNGAYQAILDKYKQPSQ